MKLPKFFKDIFGFLPDLAFWLARMKGATAAEVAAGAAKEGIAKKLADAIPGIFSKKNEAQYAVLLLKLKPEERARVTEFVRWSLRVQSPFGTVPKWWYENGFYTFVVLLNTVETLGKDDRNAPAGKAHEFLETLAADIKEAEERLESREAAFAGVAGLLDHVPLMPQWLREWLEGLNASSGAGGRSVHDGAIIHLLQHQNTVLTHNVKTAREQGVMVKLIKRFTLF